MTVENTPEQIRNASLSEYRDIMARARDNSQPQLTSSQTDQLAARQEELRKTYFENLPVVTLSRCPFCHGAFKSYFDPWGIDGLWWQEDELIWPLPDVENCKHFVLMQGAVNLNGLPPQGGLSEALTGPEQPFVAPRILSNPGMQLVVSKFELANGYSAYPLIYFSGRPPKPSMLMETWRCQTYGWTTADGRPGWSICVDPWDFDFHEWTNNKQAGWIPTTISLETQDKIEIPTFGTYESYPFAHVTGRMARLKIIADRLVECALPDGTELNPFL